MDHQERLTKGLLKVGEIAKKAGVLPSTVRYYTEIGLLKPVDYTPGGYRLYREKETLDILRRVKEIKDNRLTLKEIKKTLLKLELK